MTVFNLFKKPILSDREIKRMCKRGLLVETPIFPEQIQPNSLDLTLSGKLKIIKPNSYFQEMHTIDVKLPIEYKEQEFGFSWALRPEGEHDFRTYKPSYDNNAMYCIKPGEFVIFGTNEMLNIPNGICCIIDGRSSIARIGLSIVQGGFVDSGYHGSITLHAFNQTKYGICLYKGMRIAQAIFIRSSLSKKPYGDKTNSKYNVYGDITGEPFGSQIYKDFIPER